MFRRYVSTIVATICLNNLLYVCDNDGIIMLDVVSTTVMGNISVLLRSVHYCCFHCDIHFIIIYCLLDVICVMSFND